MKILILEDEQRNAMRLIRLLNDIDTTFIIEGPLTNIKEAVDFFQSGKTTDLILADIRLTDGLSFEALKYAPATVPIIFTTAYDEYAVQAFKFNLKSATKLFSVLLASKRPLITELADKLRLKYPLLPTISPCPTMRLEAIRSIIPISCRRYPKSV